MMSFCHLVVKRAKLFKHGNIIEWFKYQKIICEINMLNYLFHLMFWPDKDLAKNI